MKHGIEEGAPIQRDYNNVKCSIIVLMRPRFRGKSVHTLSLCYGRTFQAR